MIINRVNAKKLTMKSKRAEAYMGWLYISPMLIGYGLFFAFPLIFAIYISFTDYNLFSTPVINGLVNFKAILSDEYFGRSLLNALINAIGVPIGMGLALLLSSLLVFNKKFSLLFRTIFFLPTICGAVAITFMWQWMYAPMYGLLARLLESLGIEGIIFLDRDHFMASAIIMGVWSGMGISILMFFASLKGANQTLYEAASIDGANAFQKFLKITLPAVSPVTFFILITGISGSFQEFTRFQILGGGYSLWNIMPVWWIYNHTSTVFAYQMGYASALGMVLGLIILIISAINFIASKYWVKYDS